MSQSYTKSCMFCKKEIVMSDRASGKWLPYDLNGTVHECKNQTKHETGTKKVETNTKTVSLEELAVRLRRVEKIVFQEGT